MNTWCPLAVTGTNEAPFTCTKDGQMGNDWVVWAVVQLTGAETPPAVKSVTRLFVGDHGLRRRMLSGQLDAFGEERGGLPSLHGQLIGHVCRLVLSHLGEVLLHPRVLAGEVGGREKGTNPLASMYTPCMRL